jgi:hypothetical protein
MIPTKESITLDKRAIMALRGAWNYIADDVGEVISREEVIEMVTDADLLKFNLKKEVRKLC